jgi:hypothetical protein
VSTRRSFCFRSLSLFVLRSADTPPVNIVNGGTRVLWCHSSHPIGAWGYLIVRCAASQFSSYLDVARSRLTRLIRIKRWGCCALCCQMQQIPSGNELGEVASAPGEALVRENRGVCCVCFWASGLGEFLLHCFVYVQLSPDKHAWLKRLFLFISLVKTTLICVILLHVDFNLFLTNSRSYNSFAFTLPS